MKEIRFILILVIGGVLFWAVVAELGVLTQQSPTPDWRYVIPAIRDVKSMNITTSTFNVTGEKWQVLWYPGVSNPQDWCFVEIYNASTNVKLQEFNWSETNAESGDIKTIGSFYLKIQVYKSQVVDARYHWTIAVWEYKPQPPPPQVWLALIILIAIATALAYIGYEIFKVFRE